MWVSRGYNALTFNTLMFKSFALRNFCMNSLNNLQYTKSFYKQKQASRGVLRKSVQKICSKFIGEHPCRSVISIKLLCKFIEIPLQHGCSPVNLLHIFKTTFRTKTPLEGCFCTKVIFLQTNTFPKKQ